MQKVSGMGAGAEYRAGRCRESLRWTGPGRKSRGWVQEESIVWVGVGRV